MRKHNQVVSFLPLNTSLSALFTANNVLGGELLLKIINSLKTRSSAPGGWALPPWQLPTAELVNHERSVSSNDTDDEPEHRPLTFCDKFQAYVWETEAVCSRM